MSHTRRDFLGKAVGSVLAFYSAPLLIGCSGVIRSEIAYNPSFKDSSIKIDKNSAAILHYASLAPSGHNAQPWLVKLNSPSEWIISADPKRQLPAVDPDNRALLLGIGAFLENLSLAARAHGYEADIKIIAENAFDATIAKVTLKAANPLDYPLERLKMRRTVKKGLLANELKRDDINALTETIGHNVIYFPRTSKHAQCIEEAQVEAYRIQTHRTAAIEELKNWLRLSESEARKHQDGLTTEGMEITGIKGWYIRNFMTPEDMSSDFSKNTSIAMNEELVKQGAGWIVITSKSHHVADIIEAGRKFERMALIARERKIALAPMTQLIEEKTGQELFASHHKARIIPQMVLRVGYLDHYPDPVSLRRPVQWFTTG
jgi:hypothetical protein